MTNKVIIDDGEAENSDFMVCALATNPLYFTDNVIGECSRCGQAIQYRPHAPKPPAKICYQCVTPGIMNEIAGGEADLVITNKTAAEIFDYYRRRFGRH